MRPHRPAALVLMLVSLSTAAALAGTGWQVVASPDVSGSDFDQLNGTLATGPTEAWTVGFSRLASSSVFRALVEHWTGSSWQVVASAPISSSDDTRLYALAGTGPRDVWAVGSDAGTSVQGLIEHWNGQSWTRSSAPKSEPAGATLVAAGADSTSDAWAVGYVNSGGFQPLIEHWNGASWSVVNGAFAGGSGFDRLRAVAALSSSNVWVLGSTGRHPQPVIEHWNGAAWKIVPQPANGYDSHLDAISALSASNVWAVGSQNVTNTLVEHWNGGSWSIVPSPNASGSAAQSYLTGVDALATTNVWAVGGASTNGAPVTLTEHWDGAKWSIVPSPPSGLASLNAVSGLPAGPLFAAGYQDNASYQERTLILQH